MFHLDFGILAFYVDDIILTTHNLAFLVYFKNFLKDEYELIDLGDVHHYVGHEIIQFARWICITKKWYLLYKLKKINMHDCKPTRTPVELGFHLLVRACPIYMDKKKQYMLNAPYKSPCGSLIWALVYTQPYLLSLVGVGVQNMSNLSCIHWNVIFYYIKGMLTLYLHYTCVHNPQPL